MKKLENLININKEKNIDGSGDIEANIKLFSIECLSKNKYEDDEIVEKVKNKLKKQLKYEIYPTELIYTLQYIAEGNSPTQEQVEMINNILKKLKLNKK